MENAKPKLYIAGDELKYGKHWEINIEISKCPFCGEELPDIEINKEYENIADGDEEYYHCYHGRHML